MGRFLSGAGAGTSPRKQSIRLDVSNPAVAIPSWARLAYITGTAAGAGGSNTASAGQRGGAGGAGGFAVRHPMLINGETTLAVAIGAPGNGAAGGSNASGGNAGDTTVTVGSQVLRLEGGISGIASGNGGAGGRAYHGAGATAAGITVGPDSAPFGAGATALGGLSGTAATLNRGALGGSGNQNASGFGAGGYSLWGPGGAGVAFVPANQVGGAATGFGGGGAGSNGSGAAGNGAPGFILIEFAEATTA